MRYRLRFLLMFGLLLLLLLTTTVLYQIGMRVLEGESRDFWTALEFAAETITTTGYGADARWRTPVMVVFVVLVQLVGVMMVYMVVPIFLIPALEERFEGRLPRRVKRLRDHVVVVRGGPAVESLVEQLDCANVATVIVETDDGKARDLADQRRRVIYAPSGTEALDDVCLDRARALIVNDGDEENVNIILAARQRGFAGDILALAEEPSHRRPIQLAGATAVFTPRVILAATLAARASHRLGPRISGIPTLGSQLRISEIRIDASSPLAGRTLAQAEVGRRTETTIIGLWIGGNLVSQPPPDTVLAERTILVAIGGPDGLEKLETLAGGSALDTRTGPFLIAGFGEVGHRVQALLDEVGESVFVIDRRPRDGVDRVGDVLDQDVLDSVDLTNARGVILALDSDSATLFATVLIRGRVPELPIVARVNLASNVERIHRAGADFALSISQVSGQMLAQRLLGRDEVTVEPQLVVTKVGAHHLVGRHPFETGVRDRTGCSVVAIERGDEAFVQFDADFRVAEDDVVFVAGDVDGIERFREIFHK